MENNETNDIGKSDYQRVLRPASIVLKERDVYVYPGTKRILNWKFSSIAEQEFNESSYLNFNDFNYVEVSGFKQNCF
jgi:hypothetical protein